MMEGEIDAGYAGAMPAVLGKYRLLAELGHGGMAKVYLAVAHGPSGFSKLVVLKTIRVHLADDPETLQMFLDEARIAGRLNHPNVVHTLEVAKIDGHHIMVMEYLEGQAFASLLRRSARVSEKRPISLFLRCVIDALQGLHYAHELKDFDGTPLGLVHRDISPQNIFVTYDGQVKLLDFGIAKAVTSSSETRAGVIKGKIAYMAPEQFLGETIDHLADIYAMGSVLWHIAAGQRLWRGIVDGQVIHRVIAGDIPPPTEFNPDVHPRLVEITMKALARHREDRYATCLELQADLEALVDQLGEKSSVREIGSYTSALFTDERHEIASVVERQLSKAQSYNTQEFEKTVLPAILPATKPSAHLYSDASGQYVISTQNSSVELLSSHLGHDGSGTFASSNSATSHSIPNMHAPDVQPKKKWGSIAIVGSILLGIVVAWQLGSVLRTYSDSPSASASTAAVASSQEESVVDAAPTEVLFQIKAEPASARVFFDEVEEIGNPGSRRVVMNGKVHKIRVQSVGYETRVVELPADRDVVVTIALDPLPSSESPVVAPARTYTKGSSKSTSGESAAATAAAPSQPAHSAAPTATRKDPPNARDRIGTLDTSSPW